MEVDHVHHEAVVHDVGVVQQQRHGADEGEGGLDLAADAGRDDDALRDGDAA